VLALLSDTVLLSTPGRDEALLRALQQPDRKAHTSQEEQRTLEAAAHQRKKDDITISDLKYFICFDKSILMDYVETISDLKYFISFDFD
jgi:hypothetical protein